MKKLLLIALLTCGVTVSGFGQRMLTDRAPAGKPIIRAVGGGGMVVKIDTKKPLNALIVRLNEKWSFIDTGKSYWIGYTDDMYSIAAREEDAIQPLLDFINGASNEHGREGAIYCLHLIGIRSTIAGRSYEKFTSVKAREAMLKLAEQPALQTIVMPLLIRDPWQSDVPALFGVLAKSSGNCWMVVNALLRYSIGNFPIHQPIPKALDGIQLKVSGIKYNVAEPYDKAYERQFVSILESVKAMQNGAISIEETLFHAKLWGDWMTDFGDSSAIRESTTRLT